MCSQDQKEDDCIDLLDEEIIESVSNSCGSLWSSIYNLINTERKSYECLFRDSDTILNLQLCTVSWVHLRSRSMTSIYHHSVNMIIPFFLIECGLVVLLYNIYFYKDSSPVWKDMFDTIDPINFYIDVTKICNVSTDEASRIVHEIKLKMTSQNIQDWEKIYFDIVFNTIFDYKDTVKEINLFHVNELSIMAYNICFGKFLEGYLNKFDSRIPEEWIFSEQELTQWLECVSKREQTDTYERFCRGLMCTTYLNCCDHEDANVIEGMDALSRQDPEKISEMESILSNNSKNYMQDEKYSKDNRDMCSIALFDYYMRQMCNIEFVGRYFMCGYSYKRLFHFLDKYRSERMKNPPPIIFTMNSYNYIMWKDESNSLCVSKSDSAITALSYWIGYVVLVRKGKLNISVSIDNLVNAIKSTSISRSSNFLDNPFRHIKSDIFS